MLFVDDVKSIANRFGFIALVIYLNQPNNNYIDFIMVGGGRTLVFAFNVFPRYSGDYNGLLIR